MPLVLELPFGISVDFSFWNAILSWPTNELVKAVFAIGGWAALILIFFFMGAELWVNFKQARFTKTWKWVVLAVDVPLEQVQSPKAVEQIFAQISGALTVPNFGDKYWRGIKQKWFSFEIISIEGYIQFLIYTESQYRDLIEATVYAQYPMAEITEVEDYITNVSDKFPNEKDDTFVVEFGLANADPYPIRTYHEFEHSVTKDFMFNDPMAALLESFTRIGTGENLWLQIILEPTPNAWKEAGIATVKQIIAQKPPTPKESIFSLLLSIPIAILSEFWAHVSGSATADPKTKEKKKETPPGKVSDLSPGMKDTVAAIEEKISKIGFKTKIRALYAAKKDNFFPSRCMEGVVGSLNQFSIAGRNAIVPKIATLAYYAFRNYRLAEKKKKFVSAYKKRKIKVGKNPYILNIEELATLWHFPMPLVKTPLLQKASFKRAEPPINLPTESVETPLRRKGEIKPEPEDISKKAGPPDELMYG